MGYTRLATVISISLSVFLAARGELRNPRSDTATGTEDKRVFGSPRLHGKRAPDWIIRILESGASQDGDYSSIAERLTQRRKKNGNPSNQGRLCAQFVWQPSDSCLGWNRGGPAERRVFSGYRLGKKRVKEILEDKLSSWVTSDTPQQNLLQTMLRSDNSHDSWIRQDQGISNLAGFLQQEVDSVVKDRNEVAYNSSSSDGRETIYSSDELLLTPKDAGHSGSISLERRTTDQRPEHKSRNAVAQR